VSGDSAAASGEPLAADVNFDLTLTPPGPAPVWQAHGTVPSGRLATRNLRIDRVSADVALDERQVARFEPLSLDLYGGKLEGRFALDLTTPDDRFETAGRFENVSLADALAPRPDLASALRGTATSTFDATGRLGDFSSTLASLAGDGHITIDGAELASTNLLSEITRQGGFEQVKFDEPGTRADRIEADVHFDGARVRFRNATVSGINGYANLRGDSGWVDITTPASIHLEGAATLLPPLLDKLSQASPAAAAAIQIIGARPNFSVPLTIDGPFTKPSVSVRWTAVAGLPF
jgi:hypothetical protein